MYLCVDGGGSHTRAAVYNAAGVQSKRVEYGPCNPTAYGLETCAARIVRCAEALGISSAAQPIEAVLLALAGIGEEPARRRLVQHLQARIPARRYVITSDAHALLYANVSPPQGGVVVIAGTGSGVLASTPNGEVLRVGGWGPLLGDPGSAYRVAEQALRTTLSLWDETSTETPLFQALCDEAGVENIAALVEWSARASKADVGALARVVDALAEQHDNIAIHVLREQAGLLARQVVAAYRRAGLSAPAPVYFVGGVLEHSRTARECFTTVVSEALGTHVDIAPCRGTDAVFTLRDVTSSETAITVCTSSADALVLPETEEVPAEPTVDTLQGEAFVERMLSAEQRAWHAVRFAAGEIWNAVAEAAQRWRQGGRVIYVGAGTSGRLGVLDAAEWEVTFGIAPNRVTALLAGGAFACRRSVEGAEDDTALATREIAALAVGASDCVLGLSASGTTPYVRAALCEAKRRGAYTVLVYANASAVAAGIVSDMESTVDLAILLPTGGEVVAGSTRLSAATATKLFLNIFSTGVACQLGLVCRGLMVGMKPRNKKLKARAVRIVALCGKVDEPEAERLLSESGWDIPVAIVRAWYQEPLQEARQRLQNAAGNIARLRPRE